MPMQQVLAWLSRENTEERRALWRSREMAAAHLVWRYSADDPGRRDYDLLEEEAIASSL
jgi:hypothetical protein